MRRDAFPRERAVASIPTNPGSIASVRDFLLPLRGQRRSLTCFPFHSAPISIGAGHLKGPLPAQRRQIPLHPFP